MKLLLLCLALFCCGSQAAKRLRAGQVATEFMAKRSVDAPKPTIREILALTPDEDVESQRTLMTAKGTLKTRYEETYKGIPIYGSVITADDEDASDIEGTFVREIDQDLSDVTPELSSDDAIALAKATEGDEVTHDDEAQLYIYTHEDEARLVYVTNYVAESDDKVSRPFHIIDAKNGEIIDSWDGIESHQMAGFGGNEKIGHYKYGTDYPHLDTTSADGQTCVLQNNNVKVIHMQFGRTNTQAHSVPCSTGATDEINGAKSPAHDALYFGGVVFNMFKDWYNTAPLTMSLTLRVHYNRNYENAFWDGRQMTFGDGASRFYPLVCLDVTAHEVSHGFTQQNSNLRYKAQSGGINEAFSDMSGETAEYFSRGSNDWKMGYDIFKAAGSALRYMDDPENDGRSIGHASKYRNGMDVHYSSGVYNKMFYKLATSPGWDPKKAFAIMVRANQMYWGVDTTFDEGAVGVMKACKDLGYDDSYVKEAFEAVGVSYRDNPTPTAAPPPNPNPNPNPNPSQATPIQGYVRNLSGAQGSSRHFVVTVKRFILYVRVLGGSGNPDLYIRKGSLASPTKYTLKSTNPGAADTIYRFVWPGKYYINLYGASAYRGAILIGIGR